MSTHKITFITSNANKLSELQSWLKDNKLPFEIVSYNVDLEEIQGTCEEIAKHKAKVAYSLLREPVFIEDTSLSFNALKGLPGPYIKSFLQAIGCDGLYKLLFGFQDKSAIATCIFAYGFSDTEEPLLFRGDCLGEIVSPSHSQNQKAFGWDLIFKPNVSEQTFADLEVAIKNRISHRARALEALKKHFEQ